MGGVAALGDLLVDVSCRPSMPIRPDTDTPSANRIEAGGQAANVAAWSAVSGATARLICRRSLDPVGILAEERCRARGVDVVGPQGPEPAGIVVALVDAAGGRSMLTDRGASLLLAADDVRPAYLEGVSWLFLTCYSLLREPTIGAVAAAVTAARSRGTRIAVDLASRGSLEEAGVPAVLARVRAIAPDLLLGTEDELLLAGDGLLAPLVVAKRGSAGAALRGALRAERAAAAGEVVDTLGAGDALAGGMLAALALGRDPVAALERGLAAAAVCVGRRGAMPPG
jgi:sugar/nucleoside kinase (ribokinase family)